MPRSAARRRRRTLRLLGPHAPPAAIGSASCRAAQDLLATVQQLRGRVDPVFAPDTAWQGMTGAVPSTGHCAVVSLLVAHRLGGALASTTVEGDWHWFARVPWDGQWYDVDATADQFGPAGAPPVRVAPAGTLYPGAEDEPLSAITPETWARAAQLAQRAGLLVAATWCRARATALTPPPSATAARLSAARTPETRAPEAPPPGRRVPGRRAPGAGR